MTPHNDTEERLHPKDVYKIETETLKQRLYKDQLSTAIESINYREWNSCLPKSCGLGNCIAFKLNTAYLEDIVRLRLLRDSVYENNNLEARLNAIGPRAKEAMMELVANTSFYICRKPSDPVNVFTLVFQTKTPVKKSMIPFLGDRFFIDNDKPLTIKLENITFDTHYIISHDDNSTLAPISKQDYQITTSILTDVFTWAGAFVAVTVEENLKTPEEKSFDKATEQVITEAKKVIDAVSKEIHDLQQKADETLDRAKPAIDQIKSGIFSVASVMKDAFKSKLASNNEESVNESESCNTQAPIAQKDKHRLYVDNLEIWVEVGRVQTQSGKIINEYNVIVDTVDVTEPVSIYAKNASTKLKVFQSLGRLY